MLKRRGMLLTLALFLICGELARAGTESVSGVTANPQAPASSFAPEVHGPSGTHDGSRLDQDSQNTLDLALKTITLTQGEKGIALWRLKAEWASMQKESGRIVVQRPILTYFMPEKDKTLLVVSDSGIIDQKEYILEFVNNVHISQGDKVIKGDLLVYNGTAKTMTFPQGGTFIGAQVFGDASFLLWDVNQKLIRAEGGVSVRFNDSESPPPLTHDQGK